VAVPLIESRLNSGLVLATTASDEASVRMALKRHDPDLTLTPDIDPDTNRIVWTVMKRVGETRHVVCRWRDNQHPDRPPLPLSHGLVEHVKRLDVNSRSPKVDAQTVNDRRRERQREEDAEMLAEYAHELVKRLRGHSTPVLPRGSYRRNTRFRDVTDVR
jgi:hypothetical protein